MSDDFFVTDIRAFDPTSSFFADSKPNETPTEENDKDTTISHPIEIHPVEVHSKNLAEKKVQRHHFFISERRKNPTRTRGKIQKKLANCC